MRIALAIAALPALIWLLMTLLLWVAQSRLTFPGAFGGLPRDASVIAGEDAEARAHGVEVIALRTADGRTLRAWLHPAAAWDAAEAAGPRRAVLYVGGNNEALLASTALGATYQRRGWSMLALSLAGYPGSEGSPSEAAFREDVAAAWAWLRAQGVAPRHILLHGRSMGGGAVATMLGEVQPAGLILESTFTALPDVAAHHYPWVPVRTLMRHRLSVHDRAASFAGPTLIAHSRADGVIPSSHAEANAEAFAKATLVLVDGLTHNHSVLLHHPGGREAWWTFLDALGQAP